MMIVRLPAMGRIHHTLGCMPKNTFMRALKNNARSTKHVPVYISVFQRMKQRVCAWAVTRLFSGSSNSSKSSKRLTICEHSGPS